MKTEPHRSAEHRKSAARKTWLWALAGIAAFVVLLNIANEPEAGDLAIADARATAPQLTAAQRMEACQRRVAHYRELGVWTAGGVKPLVSRAAWDELEAGERDEVFAAAACLATAGQAREVIVTVADDEGFSREIETRRVAVQ